MELLSPAKINLFLQVVGKRPDNYHDLISLMCCVSLCDRISLVFGVSATTLACLHPDIPRDETNLAFAAADLFFKSLNKGEGVGITIEKRIPVAAGLGGGSSNAATVLAALNKYYDFPFSQKELISMGRSIGADVPFFLFGRPAIVSGVGEQIEAYNSLEKLNILLINPGFEVSTAKVYKNLNLRLTKCKKKLSYSLLKKQGFDIRRHLCNDLETAAAGEYPEILTAKKTLLNHGAIDALMSGSGPTVFGLFADSAKARRASKRIYQENTQWRMYLVDVVTQATGNKIQGETGN